jgi:hypothetical protein
LDNIKTVRDSIRLEHKKTASISMRLGYFLISLTSLITFFTNAMINSIKNKNTNHPKAIDTQSQINMSLLLS